jgi:glycosyltransferase involved in cell wall biosynthesis
MIFAIDTHHLLLEHAGTKRVTLNLIDQFKKKSEVELILLAPSYSLSIGTGIYAKMYAHLIRFFWVQFHLPILCLLKKTDFLLSPEYYCPLFTHCKRGVIAHDAHIRAQKEFINPIWFHLYYVPFIERAIRRADIIFTVSEFSKRQIMNLMNFDESKIKVIYNGLDQSFLHPDPQADLTELFRKLNIKSKEYIAFIGTFEARKNIERLIQAFSIFKKRADINRPHLKLLIIGKASSGMFSDRKQQIMNLIDRLNLKEDVVLSGYVADQYLPALYRESALITFPSLYEGFGLPIIEGFASKVPVLTSNICSMPEIGGNAVILVDPYDVADIAEKLINSILNQDLRQQLIANGSERLKLFSWEYAANQMLSNIQKCISLPSSQGHVHS